MTLARGADRLESARLVLRRITPADLPFFTRIHALPEVVQHLYPGGRPRSPQETAAFLQSIFESYEELELGYLAVLRKQDSALIGRCGLMELVVESTVPEHGIRKGWFGPPEADAGVALTYECELGYTFDPAVWGQVLSPQRSGRPQPSDRQRQHIVLNDQPPLLRRVSAGRPELRHRPVADFCFGKVV